jgi:hypothetical protein
VVVSDKDWAGIVLMSTCSLPSLSMLTAFILRLVESNPFKYELLIVL